MASHDTQEHTLSLARDVVRRTFAAAMKQIVCRSRDGKRLHQVATATNCLRPPSTSSKLQSFVDDYHLFEHMSSDIVAAAAGWLTPKDVLRLIVASGSRTPTGCRCASDDQIWITFTVGLFSRTTQITYPNYKLAVPTAAAAANEELAAAPEEGGGGGGEGGAELCGVSIAQKLRAENVFSATSTRAMSCAGTAAVHTATGTLRKCCNLFLFYKTAMEMRCSMCEYPLAGGSSETHACPVCEQTNMCHRCACNCSCRKCGAPRRMRGSEVTTNKECECIMCHAFTCEDCSQLPGGPRKCCDCDEQYCGDVRVGAILPSGRVGGCSDIGMRTCVGCEEDVCVNCSEGATDWQGCCGCCEVACVYCASEWQYCCGCGQTMCRDCLEEDVIECEICGNGYCSGPCQDDHTVVQCHNCSNAYCSHSCTLEGMHGWRFCEGCSQHTCSDCPCWCDEI